MKRFLHALVPWMALATLAHGQVRTADVLYTHFDDVPTRAYRVGDECFVAIDDISRWGWQANVSGDTVSLTAEGQTLKIPMRVISGRPSLPLRAAVTRLGGLSDWTLGTDTLAVSSELTEIRSENGKLFFAAPLGFAPKATVLTNPGRVVIDLAGVRIGPNTKKSLDITTRVNQYKPNAARMIIETDKVPNLASITPDGTRQLQLELQTPVVPEPQTEPQLTDPSATAPTNPADLPPLTSLPIELQQETGSRVSMRISLGERITGPAEVRVPDPLTLQIFMPGVQVGLAEGFSITTDAILGAQAEVLPEGTLLTFNLTRPLGAEVVTQGGTVIITLLKPNVGDGKLAGKVIVVDPGHGGFDGGTKAGTLREKDLNLKIGKLIAQALTAEGATVIMTRQTDVFITLDGRAALANRSGADLFISNHINSTGGSRLQSGTITFHHKGEAISRVLAGCIQTELAKVNKLPDLGVWSDSRIYPKSGFSVLRQTKMTGVLIEMGFINHPRDRARMVSDEFQKSMAAAVVRGIKVFLGDAKTKK